MRITLLGAGAWGSALAVSLAGQHTPTLWARHPDLCAALRSTRQHPQVLAGIQLPAVVQIESDMDRALAAAELVIVTVAVAGARSTLQALAHSTFRGPVLLACKGFEPDSGLLPHELAATLLPTGCSILSLSGPSFAAEIAAGLPAALVLSGTDPQLLELLVRTLHHPRLRLYSNSDPTGVEIAGALKNVIAIAAGTSDGLGLGLNARAALITRGLAEIRRLGEAFGARADTFLGLAGVGDLMLTCTATLSRNYRVGFALAEGRPLATILSDLGEVAEGVATAGVLPKVLQRAGVDMPICTAVAAVLTGQLAPGAAMRQLLDRDPRAES